MGTIEKNGKSFRKLTVREVMGIERDVFNTGREALLKDLNAAGASASDKTVALLEYRKKEGTVGELLDWIRKPAGQAQVLSMSLGGEGLLDEIELGYEERFYLAAELCGFERVNNANDGGDDNDGFQDPTKATSEDRG